MAMGMTTGGIPKNRTMWYLCIMWLLSFFIRASSMRCLCAANSRSRSFCLFAGSFRFSRASNLSIALARFLIALRLSRSTAAGLGLCGRLVLSRFLASFSTGPEDSVSWCGRLFPIFFFPARSCELEGSQSFEVQVFVDSKVSVQGSNRSHPARNFGPSCVACRERK